MSNHQKLYTRILILLKENEVYRDSDTRLCARIWWEETKETDTKVAFLDAYVKGKIPSADSITRLRRKAQENYPQLEGKTRADKKINKTEKVKKDLKTMK